MADSNYGAPPNHLGTSVPSGAIDEKKGYDEKPADLPPKKEIDEEEEDDEDIDALIEELESQDANIDLEEEEVAQPGGARTVPEELLQTSTVSGLSSSEVLTRRKRYGLNQMKEEKENLILKFLGFFIGPIQFVMEVSLISIPIHLLPKLLLLATTGRRGCWSFCNLIVEQLS